MRPFDPGGHPRSWIPERVCGSNSLYRFYDADRQLLYIGITGGSPYMRWTGHRRYSAWWPLAAFVSIAWVTVDREACVAMERAAIRAERPRYNKEHNRLRIRMELRLDGGPDAIVEQLRHVLFPDDFASLAAAFAVEAAAGPDRD